ncbi:MAG TPA: septum formation initiator family protein [Solirubrobacteraceae bacterium]|jgi:cell division protein FtsB
MPPARSATAAPRRRVRTRPRPRRVTVRSPKLRVRWDRAGRIGLLVVLGVVMGLYVQHTLSYISTKSQADHQQAIVDRLQRQNRVLERQQKSLGNPATIVQDARELGMVRPGERPYVIPGLADH